jgi:hypothetical protein
MQGWKAGKVVDEATGQGSEGAAWMKDVIG